MSTTTITHRCGHATDWPTNPSSEARAEIEASVCEACYRAADPDGAAEHDDMLDYLEAEGREIAAE